MLKFKRVLIYLLCFAPNVFAVNHSVVLENSTLLEFAHIVADMIKRPVIISTDLNRPFSISATFKNDSDLIALLKSSVLSSGLKFDERGKALVISANGFLDNPDFLTKTYALSHVPSDYVY